MNKAITSQEKDFAKWYTDVIRAARLADYSSIKGFMIYEPNGYALWESIQEKLNNLLKSTGHQNVYMPTLIPENLLSQESDLIEGFSPEVAWVTQGGDTPLDSRLAIRPTSETLFGQYFSKVIHSYKDLPLKLNQWCNVVRWEKSSRPFLRNREFLWQEGHTAHATAEDAQFEANDILQKYKFLLEHYLAMPVCEGLKTESEKFAGACFTLTLETLMKNGVSLQAATSHYFGQKFAKAYDVKFTNQQGQLDYAYTTSWGISTRLIGGLIMTHSDDDGLVLPPYIAPIQAIVVPINSNCFKYSNQVKEKLIDFGISAEVDLSPDSPGKKFANSEVKGIPIRIEIGDHEIENKTVTCVARDNHEKSTIEFENLILVHNILNLMQSRMYAKALKNMEAHTHRVSCSEELLNSMKTSPGFYKGEWCGNPECEKYLKDAGAIRSRCILKDCSDKKCIVCGKKSQYDIMWGIQY